MSHVDTNLHTKTTKCVFPNCERLEHARGLCGSCYMAARTAIKLGEADEEDLVNRGLMLPKNVQRSTFFGGKRLVFNRASRVRGRAYKFNHDILGLKEDAAEPEPSKKGARK